MHLNKEVGVLREKLNEVSQKLADAQRLVAEMTGARAALLRSIANLEEVEKKVTKAEVPRQPRVEDNHKTLPNGRLPGDFIRESVDRMRGEFSVNEVVEDLMINNPSLRQTPSLKLISNALFRLKKKNYIKMSQRGVQGKPSRYVRCLLDQTR